MAGPEDDRAVDDDVSLTLHADDPRQLDEPARRAVEARLRSSTEAAAEHAARSEILSRVRTSARSTEPDWIALERSIDLAVSRSRARARRWILGGGLAAVVAAAAAVAILVSGGPTTGTHGVGADVDTTFSDELAAFDDGAPADLDDEVVPAELDQLVDSIADDSLGALEHAIDVTLAQELAARRSPT